MSAEALSTAPAGLYYLSGLDHLGYFAFTLLIVLARGDLIVVTRERNAPPSARNSRTAGT
ncbi:MAG: hypothetical protein ACRDQ7_16745 [Haloechinothrix sp.]